MTAPSKPSKGAVEAARTITSKRKYAQSIGYAGICDLDQARIIEAEAVRPEVEAVAGPLAEALERLMAELPSNKDWLDPALEAEARAVLTAYRSREEGDPT